MLLEDRDPEKLKREQISDVLHKQRPMRHNQERALSNHITSRWYRPPEIILVEKNYNHAIDIWGLGCTFFEILYVAQLNKLKKMGKEIPKRSEESRFLFPGSSCFPLSPCEQMKK